MKISELIKELEKIKDEFGDGELILEHDTYDAKVSSVWVTGIGPKGQLHINISPV